MTRTPTPTEVRDAINAAIATRHCVNPRCGKTFSPPNRTQQYCTSRCRKQAANDRARAKATLAAGGTFAGPQIPTPGTATPPIGTKHSRGDRWLEYYEGGDWADDRDFYALEAKWPVHNRPKALYKKYEIDKSTLSQWRAECGLQDKRKADDLAALYPDSDIGEGTEYRLPAPGDPDYPIRDEALVYLGQGLGADALPADLTLEERLNALLACLVAYSNRFYRTDEGRVWDWAEHHLRWARLLIEAIETGGNQLVLGPPRHGKTKILVKVINWSIKRNPNTKIVYVGGAEDLAEKTGYACRSQLEHNTPMRRFFLREGLSFVPRRGSGSRWLDLDFTVAIRTAIGVEAPTFKGLGKGGTLINRDVNILIGDDLEQHKTTKTPMGREDTRIWLATQWGSRVTKAVAAFIIGSRQNSDDAYSYLMEIPSWSRSMVIETAHDHDCIRDPDDYAIHNDCMLWAYGPVGDERDYGWLQDRRYEMEGLGVGGTFDMVYLNKPVADAVAIFSRDAVQQCRRGYLEVGQTHDERGGYRLIAGLDPSGAGTQAAFLWGYQSATNRLRMIDIDAQLGGGLDKAVWIVKHWFDRYDLRHWVIEENLYQGELIKYRPLVEFQIEHGLIIEPTRTGAEKGDPVLGPTWFARWFMDDMVDLPYASANDRAKTDLLVRQLVNYSSNATSRGAAHRNRQGADLVMAMWFPRDVLEQWKMERPTRQRALQSTPYDHGVKIVNKGLPWKERETAGVGF